jgi:hypothetical protein
MRNAMRDVRYSPRRGLSPTRSACCRRCAASGHVDFIVPAIDIDQFANEEIRYL